MQSDLDSSLTFTVDPAERPGRATEALARLLLALVDQDEADERAGLTRCPPVPLQPPPAPQPTQRRQRTTGEVRA